MAIMNTYNYLKPKNHVNIDIKSKGEPKVNPNFARKKPADKTDQYLESKIMTAKPEELTLMLYNGMVKFIKRGIMALEAKNYEEVNYYTKRAQDILSELRSTLNMDVAMSEDLDSLYEYAEFKLYDANMKKDEEAFAEALNIAEEFRDTWQEAFAL